MRSLVAAMILSAGVGVGIKTFSGNQERVSTLRTDLVSQTQVRKVLSVHLWPHIPGIFAMGIPGAFPVWFLMDDHVGARRGNGIAVEVKGPKDFGPDRELGVDSASTEDVQGEVALRDELAPKVEREAFGGGTEASNEMVFVGLDGPFCCIGTVHASWGSLVLDSFFIHVFFQ